MKYTLSEYQSFDPAAAEVHEKVRWIEAFVNVQKCQRFAE
jgi:hypothetical protein